MKCTEYYNIKCLSCGIVPYELIRVGFFYMCPVCFNANFGEGTTVIEPKSELGKVYYKWLEKYKQSI